MKIHPPRSRVVLPLGLALLLVTLGTTCSSSQSDQPPTENSNMAVQASPSPEIKKTDFKDVANEPLTESDPALTQDEAWILSTKNIVNLTRKGTNTPQAVKTKVPFQLGDLLEIGDKSFATVLCKRGTCVLGLGNYNSCCTVPCQGQVNMLRRGDMQDMPIIARNELPSAEGAALIDAEKGLRALELPPVTTQFLITTLYTNWRIKEANQELDRLSIQLESPDAKQELQQLYAPVITRTGDMHFKYNRIGDAQKFYLLNLKGSADVLDPRDRAAAHVGLAQTYEVKGDKSEAISNLESARDIYMKQGDSKAAASTEKQIEKNRGIRGVDGIRKTRPLIQKSP
jgi:hypothetical protein